MIDRAEGVGAEGRRRRFGVLPAVVALLLAGLAAPSSAVAEDDPSAAEAPAPAPVAREDTVTIAAVQYRVSEERYASIDRFRASVERLVAEAVHELGAELVVFPEYINVFLIAARYPDAVAEAETLPEALAAVGDGEPVALPELIGRSAPWIVHEASALWSELADEYDVTIVAGTLFAPADRNGRPELRNRLLIFEPGGRLRYTQDKVYLTTVEAVGLGLRAGAIEAAEPIVMNGLEIGFTICRDTYFPTWHGPLDGVDVWIDLRANGEPYSREVYERFLLTLPERVVQSGAVAGVNASLTGELLGFVWAGPSYAVDASGRRIAATERPVGTGLVAIELVSAGDTWRVRALQ